jgi:hypothetical protein
VISALQELFDEPINSDELGREVWSILEWIGDNYPCKTCKLGAQALTHGGHDVVSLLLGKEGAPFTPNYFLELVRMTNEAYEKYQSSCPECPEAI